ncbi:hypothetical protein [Mycobacterium sp. NAZ190054]|uniref:hypothetical protein n=1 Tax=Mycobacterium sp. NAZ190054 TaxID=1747766 RepID=UPI000A6C2168|nr:hypothetical protein [Mycobacterium sp. NAZ190054]
MTTSGSAGGCRDQPDVRDAMRRDLRAALKARRADVASALRVAIAAIDNAEAVGVGDEPAPASGRIAGASAGLGAADVARRDLSVEDVAAVLDELIDSSLREADRYRGFGHLEAADRLIAQAELLRSYRPDLSGSNSAPFR